MYGASTSACRTRRRTLSRGSTPVPTLSPVRLVRERQDDWATETTTTTDARADEARPLLREILVLRYAARSCSSAPSSVRGAWRVGAPKQRPRPLSLDEAAGGNIS